MPEIQHQPCCKLRFLSLIQSRLAALPATTMKKLSLLASALLASAYACADDTNTNADVQKADSEIRFTAERITLPGNEGMGMLGGNYLININKNIQFGPAVYGAVTGKRGGFFTGGAELSGRYEVMPKVLAQAGVYVGGGGGGVAMVGGGLMVRPHADLLYKFDGGTAGVSVSQVRFPNGFIKSNQVGLVMSLDTNFRYSPVSSIGKMLNIDDRGGMGFDRIAVTAGAYKPASGVTDLGGVPYTGKIGYAGFRSDRFISEQVYWGIEAGAAAKGGADGYAEVLGTVGAETPVFGDVKVGARAALGLGGGGKLTVGGGSLGKVAVYASAPLTKDVFVALEGGMLRFPDGQFKAKFATVQLGVELDTHRERGEARTVRGMEWGFSGAYYPKAKRYSGSEEGVKLVGFKIDRDITANTYFSAQAHSAYDGKAGGFSVGLAGLGVKTDIRPNSFFATAEVLSGAAGGGGISSKGGAIVQGVAYAGYDFNSKARLKLGVGRVKSLKGEFNSNIFDVTLTVPIGVASR